MEIKKILEKYIKGEYNTLKQVAEENKITIDQIKYYIRCLKKSDKLDEVKLYQKYLETARKNQKQAKIKGGQAGKKTTEISQEQINEWYRLIKDNDYSLREIDAPKSTVYDALMKYTTQEEKQQLKKLFEERKKSTPYNNDLENNYTFHQIGSDMSKPVSRFKK